MDGGLFHYLEKQTIARKIGEAIKAFCWINDFSSGSLTVFGQEN